MTDAALARRLQILATEHWGLLAARSTAQSEVLTRITIHLTLVSAGLVTIGLLGQATHFARWFPAAALGTLGFLAVLGLLTLMRVLVVSEEDFSYVTAKNRIRAAYVATDPSGRHPGLDAASTTRAAPAGPDADPVLRPDPTQFTARAQLRGTKTGLACVLAHDAASSGGSRGASP